jgi:hypothetical protein
VHNAKNLKTALSPTPRHALAGNKRVDSTRVLSPMQRNAKASLAGTKPDLSAGLAEHERRRCTAPPAILFGGLHVF